MKETTRKEWENWRKVCKLLRDRNIDINKDVELWQALTAWNKSSLEMASQAVQS